MVRTRHGFPITEMGQSERVSPLWTRAINRSIQCRSSIAPKTTVGRPLALAGERSKRSSARQSEVGRRTTVSQMRQTQPTGGRGFTLIELLIAMAIVLTIAAIAVPNFIAAMDLARV